MPAGPAPTTMTLRACAVTGGPSTTNSGVSPRSAGEPALCTDKRRTPRGTLFRSITTNGLLLYGDRLDALLDAAPDKVHVSIHFPEREAEVRRVVRQVTELAERGIRSGVNFLVARSNLDAAARAAAEVR